MLLYVKPGKQVQEKEKTMEQYTLRSQGLELEFRGRILGSGTSRTFLHTNHTGFDYASQALGPENLKVKCSACRWNEVTIYGTADKAYVAYTEGRSVCPGEVDYSRIIQARGGVELVDQLTVRSRRGEAFLPRPASQALAQAAEDDDAIYDAFNDRAVI